MVRRWYPTLTAVLAFEVAGCAQATRRPDAAQVDAEVRPAAFHRPIEVQLLDPMAAPIDPVLATPELLGPQPVDAFIRRALAENRTVQAAYHNVQSLRAPHPAGDDPRRPVRVEHRLPHPERRAAVLVDGL